MLLIIEVGNRRARCKTRQAEAPFQSEFPLKGRTTENKNRNGELIRDEDEVKSKGRQYFDHLFRNLNTIRKMKRVSYGLEERERGGRDGGSRRD